MAVKRRRTSRAQEITSTLDAAMNTAYHYGYRVAWAWQQSHGEFPIQISLAVGECPLNTRELAAQNLLTGMVWQVARNRGIRDGIKGGQWLKEWVDEHSD